MAYTPIGAQGTQKKVGYTPISSAPVKKTTTPVIKNEVPFDATKKGIALNTIKGIPQAFSKVIGQPFLQATAALGGAATGNVLTPSTKFQKDLYGTDKPLTFTQAGVSNFGVKETNPIAPVLGAAAGLLELIPGGKTLKQNIKTVNELAGARRLFKDAGVADDVIDTLKLDSRAVATKTDAEAEALIKEATEATANKTPTPVPTAPLKVADEVVPAYKKTQKQYIKETADAEIQKEKSLGGDVKYTSERYGTKEASEDVVRRVGSDDTKVIAEFFIKKNPSLRGIKVVTGVDQKFSNFVIGKNADGTFNPEKSKILLNKDATPVTVRHEIEHALDASRGVPDDKRVLGFEKYPNIPHNDFNFAYAHRQSVKQALREGKSVPEDVLADYPDLKPLPSVEQNLPPLPKLPTSQSSDQVISSALERYRVGAQKPETVLPDVAKAASIPTSPGGAMVLAGKLLTPISSRLARINPKLKEVLRRFEYNVAQNTHKDSVRVLPLLNATKQLSKEESLIFDLARKNGDADVINALAKKYGFEKELRESQRVLDEIYDRAKQVGIEIPYRENYFPRVVKNPKKYVAYLRSQPDWSEIQERIAKHAADKGKKYTDLTPEEIAGIVNNFLRGFGNKIDLAKPGFAKKRSVEVIDDSLNEFYESSDSALSTYVIRMNDEIEGRKFFGKALDVDEKVLNTQDSIGAYVMDLIQKGELDPQFVDEVSDILKARFARGKMNGALDTFRNMEYISTMGSPISAVTQIGDLAWSVYDNGLYNTAKALGKSAFGKRANRVTKEDLGIEQITQEFQNQTKTGKALEKVFKIVGMERLDRLGKETLVNAEFSKFKSLAQRNDPKLRQLLARTFDPNEVPAVMKEFADGKITDNTKLVLFNKLLDFQPVAKSEMPQAYLEHPNGRIAYMLKSFTLKQYDIFRREAIDKITSGDKRQAAEGMKNLILLSGAFTMANATADEIKDLILGRDTPPSDRVADNLWRLLGASKYDVYKARQDGIGQTVGKKILSPTSLFDRAYKDITNKLEGKEYEKGPLKGDAYKLESTQSIPLVGKLYYWWFGRGEQKEQYKAGGKGEFPELPELPKLPGLPKLPKISV